MNILNKAFAQITELFRSMTPGARIAAGLLLAVVVISLAYLVNHGVSGPDDFLMSGETFGPGQLPAMEAAFAKAGLSNYQIDGSRIRVPHGQQTAYVAALADSNALPKNFGDYLEGTLKDGGMFVERSRQKELLKVALQRELARIIGSMRGIENASVLFDVQVDEGLNPKHLSTASVSVKPIGNQPLEEERVEMIRQVVAGAIAGLSPGSVAVADLNSDRIWPAGSENNPSGGSLDPYGAAKRMYEKQWKDKIQAALAYIPGATVEVNVELNPELETNSTETNVDPKPVPVEVSETSRNTNSQSSSPGGRPGLAAQGAVSANAPATVATGNRSEDESTSHKERDLVTTKSSVSRKAGLTPKRVTVTVGVLSSYYEKIWRERNPTPTGAPPKQPDANALATIETDEQEKIRKYVFQLIPLPDDKVAPDPTKVVTVTTFQHLPTPPLTPPSIAEQGLGWLQQYWSTLGMLGLGMVSLVMLRSVVRSVPAPAAPRPQPAAAPSVAPEEAEESTAEATEQAPRPKRRSLRSGPTLRDELADMVREDPDAAANILRNWIGSTN